METYYNDLILQKLPERGTPLPGPVDYACTEVEQYVRDVVEAVEPLEESDEVVRAVIASLLSNGVTPPVTIADAVLALQQKFTKSEITALLKAHDPLMPRLLKALNGPTQCAVPDAVLREAASRERIMSSAPAGWGVYDPPTYATAWRLLTSAGLPEQMLPEYRTLPPRMRPRLMDAWAEACMANGWEVTNPSKDERAERVRGRRSM